MFFDPPYPNPDRYWKPGEYEAADAAWREHHYGDHTLRALCDRGAKRFAAGNYDAIRFDLFNLHETMVVKDYMSQTHPHIPFFTTRCV